MRTSGWRGHGSRDLFVFACFLSFSFFFWPRRAAFGMLVPQPGIKPGAPAVRVPSPNRWTAREFPPFVFGTPFTPSSLTQLPLLLQDWGIWWYQCLNLWRSHCAPHDFSAFRKAGLDSAFLNLLTTLPLVHMLSAFHSFVVSACLSGVCV